MSYKSSSVLPPRQSENTIPFRSRGGQPEKFMALFREGMALVEETANYLDGAGRRESKTLTPFIALAYATESMRLTTRLTQMATWLLARRAAFNGEELPHAGSPNDPLMMPPVTRVAGSKGYEELPEKLKGLIEASYQFHTKIYRFDALERGITKPQTPRPNPVATQFAKLAAAFDFPTAQA